MSCKSPGPTLKDRQGDSPLDLSWTMKRFLEPASRVRLRAFSLSPQTVWRWCGTVVLTVFHLICVWEQHGSLSSETELSQYFSQDASGHSFSSESVLMGSNSDEALQPGSCSTSMDDNSARPLGEDKFSHLNSGGRFAASPGLKGRCTERMFTCIDYRCEWKWL